MVARQAATLTTPLAGHLIGTQPSQLLASWIRLTADTRSTTEDITIRFITREQRSSTARGLNVNCYAIPRFVWPLSIRSRTSLSIRMSESIRDLFLDVSDGRMALILTASAHNILVMVLVSDPTPVAVFDRSTPALPLDLMTPPHVPFIDTCHHLSPHRSRPTRAG